MSETRGLEAIEELAEAMEGEYYPNIAVRKAYITGCDEYRKAYADSGLNARGFSKWLMLAVNDVRAEIEKMKAAHDQEMEGMVSWNDIAFTHVELPKGADGKVIHLGDTVYGRDGQVWTVQAIGHGNHQVYVSHFGKEKVVRKAKPEWMTHERPKTYPLDAEGVECRPGDTVWFTDDPVKMKKRTVIDAFTGGLVSLSGLPGGWNASSLTHTEPDSWEKLERDSRNSDMEYWGCANSTCSNCPSIVDGRNPKERYGCYGCYEAVKLDILHRAKALAGVTPKCSEATPKEGAE